jgi:hypothetical protein
VAARPHPGPALRRDRFEEENAADHDAIFEHGIIFRVVANRPALEDQRRHRSLPQSSRITGGAGAPGDVMRIDQRIAIASFIRVMVVVAN